MGGLNRFSTLSMMTLMSPVSSHASSRILSTIPLPSFVRSILPFTSSNLSSASTSPSFLPFSKVHWRLFSLKPGDRFICSRLPSSLLPSLSVDLSLVNSRPLSLAGLLRLKTIKRNLSSSSNNSLTRRHGTTILCVRRGGKVCIAGDGMVSQGSMIVKPNAKKIRRVQNNEVILGFAGATADCFTLVEKLEAKMEEYPGQLMRSCVELAKLWRTDRYLRNLEAVLIVADKNISLEVSGNGDVLESHDGILAVGSGGPYASAAARAFCSVDGLSAEEVVRRSMKIAGDMCCHTNHNLTLEILDSEDVLVEK